MDSKAPGARDDFPEFVPRIEALVSRLGLETLPVQTKVGLMRHYETLGNYAKAEDALYAILDDEPASPGLIEWGRQFYERLLRQTDEALALGNLPRAEVEMGLAELKSRL